MSYARFGRNSDVYVFENSDGFWECMRCELTRPDPWLETPGEMAKHLRAHSEAGHKVPGDAITALEQEQAQVELGGSIR